MAQNRLIGALTSATILVLLLAGCGQQTITPEQLQAASDAAYQQGSADQKKKDDIVVAAWASAHAKKQENLAAIGQWCKITAFGTSSLCSAETVEAADEAIRKGWRPPAPWVGTWLVLERLLWGTFWVLMAVLAAWITLRWLRPSAAKIKRAKDTINTAEEKAKEATARADKAQQQRLLIEREMQALERNKQKLQAELDELRREHAELRVEVERKKKDIDLLGGFS